MADGGITYASEPALTPDGVETLARCGHCATPYVPRSRAHVFCSDGCREAAKLTRPSRKAAQSRRGARAYELNVSYRAARRALVRAGIDPETVPAIQSLRGRGRVDGWREEIGLSRRRSGPSRVAPTPDALDPWSMPSPRVEHIGHALAVAFYPAAAIDLTTTRLLHGAITHATAAPHMMRVGRWSLAPSGGGWVAVFSDRALAERMRAQHFDARMGVVAKTLAFGAHLAHVRAPRVLAPGRYRVTIETITPVSWASSGHTRATIAPSPETIMATVERIALAVGAHAPEAFRAVASVACETRRTDVRLGGHWQRGTRRTGVALAIEGRLTVECNAVVAWLLACAEVVGLGGATSLGLGRVRVRVAHV